MNPLNKLEIYGIALLILVLVLGGVYFKGRHDGAETVQLKMDTYVAKVDARDAKAREDAAKEKAERERITLEQEKRYAQDAASLNAKYAAAIARLRPVPEKTGTSTGSGVPPVPPTTRVCNDPAENNRLLTALLGYRQSVLGILQTCEGQTKQLVEAQAWLKAQQAVK